MSELEKLIDELRQVKRGQKSFALSDMRDLIERAADRLDAAKPERAPVDGWCPCGGSEWDEKNIRWMTQIGAGCTKTAFFGLSFCPGCGAALLAGYAERGGSGADTRRVETLIALARDGLGGEYANDVATAHLTVMERGTETEWCVSSEMYDDAGSDLDPRVALDKAAAALAAESEAMEYACQGCEWRKGEGCEKGFRTIGECSDDFVAATNPDAASPAAPGGDDS